MYLHAAVASFMDKVPDPGEDLETRTPKMVPYTTTIGGIPRNPSGGSSV